MTSCELKAFHNRTVSITFHDGEIATARLTCMSEGSCDVMVDILGTNRPESYAQLDTCSYIVPASELAAVVEISDAPVVTEGSPQSEPLRGTLHAIEPILNVEDAPAESLRLRPAA